MPEATNLFGNRGDLHRKLAPASIQAGKQPGDGAFVFLDQRPLGATLGSTPERIEHRAAQAAKTSQ